MILSSQPFNGKKSLLSFTKHHNPREKNEKKNKTKNEKKQQQLETEIFSVILPQQASNYQTSVLSENIQKELCSKDPSSMGCSSHNEATGFDIIYHMLKTNEHSFSIIHRL